MAKGEQFSLLGEVEMGEVPKGIRQTFNSNESPHWREAVMEEMNSITLNEVLSEPMKLPKGQQSTATKMLFVKKYNAYGAVER